MLSKNWEMLRNYESFELVKTDYYKRHGRTPNTSHAREIAAPFAHARSYFSSAASADQTVKPLLLYYGVLSLSRGLTLALSRGRREATLAPAHGLAIKQWGDELSKEQPDFSALNVIANDAGTFAELCRATNYRSHLRNNSSQPNNSHINRTLALEAQYTLGELLARQPSLKEHYARWQGAPRCCGPVGVETVDVSNEVLFRVSKASRREQVTREFCDVLFAGSACVFDAENGSDFVYRGPNNIDLCPGFTDAPDFLEIGSLWLTARYSAGTNLSNIASVFVLSYILGMLVRYFPTQWTGLIRAQIGDAALPTLSAAIDWIETEYPRLVLTYLHRDRPVT